MDKNRIEGSVKQVPGAAKIALGKAIGDAKLQHDGKADEAEGRAPNAIGGFGDALGDAARTPKQ